jgi:hypothetical protein
LVGSHILGTSLGQYLPFIYDIGPVGDLKSVPDIMVGKDDPQPLLFLIEDDSLKLDDGQGIDSCERFIQEKELRLKDEESADLEAPPLTP